MNALTDSIPPELGNLSRLERLWLGRNRPKGGIPPELGNLSELRDTWLGGNALEGPVPPELGNLRNHLGRLNLEHNQLTGLLPRSLLAVATLRHVRFEENANLCAPGVADFVSWSHALETFEGPFCSEADTGVLESLFESAGGSGWTQGWLDGPVLASWHGVSADSLGRVTALDLSRNGLAGRLPRNMGALARMAELGMAGNTELSGRLPLSLADLSLRALSYDGTALCVPGNASFQRWLSTVESHDGTGTGCTQAIDSVAVSPAESTIAALGDTVRLAAEAFDANGHAVGGAEFSWESSAASVATVDAAGLLMR